MSPPKIIRSIYTFLSEMLDRDRYFAEVLAALATFGVGIIASVTQERLSIIPSVASFRTMPFAEIWVMAFSVPGVMSAIKLWREGEKEEGKISLGIMLSFSVLAIFSLLVDLDNWGFWALFALQLGLLKGYALIREWTYLRWSVSVLGSFFWINLTICIAADTLREQPLALAPFTCFALANLVSVWRVRGVRYHA